MGDISTVATVKYTLVKWQMCFYNLHVRVLFYTPDLRRVFLFPPSDGVF